MMPNMEVNEQSHCVQPGQEPGPASCDSPVLTLQAEHRSSDIEKGKDLPPLKCRRADQQFWKMQPLDERVLHHLAEAGFYGVYSIGHLPIDPCLVTALVERWREETHTFHFPVGESTVTLQDVAVLLGLPVDGDPITSPESSKKIQEWQVLCQELLGFIPSPSDFNGNRLRLRCLDEKFKSLPLEADDDMILCHARAHILRLIGAVLFPDKSQSKVKLMFLPFLRDLQACGRLSWGSAVLASLYREMCRASKSKAQGIGGPLILLQLWAWERLLPMRLEKIHPTEQQPCIEVEPLISDSVVTQDIGANGAPQGEHDGLRKPLGSRWRERFKRKKGGSRNMEIYRNQLNQLKDGEFIWRPYSPEVIAQMPSYCLVGEGIWQTLSPLICFSIVEWHLPNRVMRQFGLKQMKPTQCDTCKDLHGTDMRGRKGYDFEKLHSHHVMLWKNRHQQIVHGEPFDGPMADDDPYLVWYRGITRLTIANPNHRTKAKSLSKGKIAKMMAQAITSIYQKADESMKNYSDSSGLESLAKIHKTCLTSLEIIQKHHWPAGVASEILASTSVPVPTSPPMQSQKRVRGLVAPRLPRKSRKRTSNGAPSLMTADMTNSDSSVSPLPPISAASPSTEVAPLSVALLHDPLSAHTDSLSTSVPLSSQSPSSLPIVVGQLSSSLLPPLDFCPPIPLSWPSTGCLNREWVMDLERALDWSSRNIPPKQFSSMLPEEILDQLILLASSILRKEPNCVRIDEKLGLQPRSRVMVVGDLHGQLHDLLFLLRDAGYPDDDRFFVFNGDYVDKGAWGLETFIILLAWKVLLPQRVHLLRGNHETGLCSTLYGFKQEISVKYGAKGKNVYQKCLDCFKKLPLASVIAGKVYTAHGGLFRSIPKKKKNMNATDKPIEIGSLEDLYKIRRFLMNPPSNGRNALSGDVLWSDPSMSPGLSENDERRIGLFWGPDCTEEFLRKSNLKLIIRSREGPDAREKRLSLRGMDEGYTIDHVVESGRLITVFSAPDYPQFQAVEEEDRFYNKGAYIVLEPPDFDSPSVRIFDAVTPRPEAKAYYDYENVAESDEDISLWVNSDEELDHGDVSDVELEHQE